MSSLPCWRRKRILQTRPIRLANRLMPSAICVSLGEEKFRRIVFFMLPIGGEEGAAGHEGDALLCDGAREQSGPVDAIRQRHPDEKTAFWLRPGHAGGHFPGELAESIASRRPR